MTLEPGDVVITGTPAGVGYAKTPPVFMKPGDVCEVEIERIGVLRNPIQDARYLSLNLWQCRIVMYS
jgi:acylpyruvate hydrolase